MIVSNTEPFEVIYSLYEHEFLGFLFEAYAVQLNHKNQLTFQSQSVSTKNVSEFSSKLDKVDFELVKLLDNIQQDVILKKFNKKKSGPVEFFYKVFDNEKGDKALKEVINGYLEKYRSEILSRLKGKRLFIMGKDGEPTWKEVDIVREEAKAYFHFEREEDHTVYYPIIKCAGEKVKFQFKNAKILCDFPACLLVEDKLYFFDKYVDGKKIKPFLAKPNIIIPRKIEETYYEKFIVPLVANFNVFAKGFEIKKEEFKSSPTLLLSELTGRTNTVLSLFDEQEEEPPESDEESTVALDLSFNYNTYNFRFDSFAAPAYVYLEKSEDSWVFHKIKRDLEEERRILVYLKELGLDLKSGRVARSRNEIFSWLQRNAIQLEQEGINVKQSESNPTQYFLGYSYIDIKIEEKNDWFDINALVRFGEFEIPFIRLRNLIIENKKEFLLPNGQIAVIPEEWFTRYSELFDFAELEEDENVILKKHHLALVQNLDSEGHAKTVISRKLERLRHFEEIENRKLPAGFVGTLRPYQKAGYDWMHFLKDFKLGGCLADDMGLGKTVMTLAFLQSIKEEKPEHPSLLVMPTSLVYNWQLEARRFAPKLKILIHFGTLRAKNTDNFSKYDLVIVSYGVLRLDIDFIRNFRFNYAILDESQAIKNSTSNIFKAVMDLNTSNRLILTGTPLENSTLDLWSQMTFINPGLLGTLQFFKSFYQNPIEKQKNEEVLKRLFSKIKPFMLRRHKSQVATELPEKIESVHYCNMTETQEKLYEETKSYFRNLIMEGIEKKGVNQSHILVLQGLNKLRQLANNPLMVDEAYEGDSGKDHDVMHKLRDVVEEGYKTLIFSQYVKHLTLIRKQLDEEGISYCYLDGSTQNRQDVVNKFQNDPSVKVFLISLKAGGVGLNLTAAEYVFLLDPWWNPAIEAQAVDRAHRIGQKNTVFTYKFITRNSVEEKILALQNSKRQLFDDLITTEESFMKSLSQNDILSLLE
ncbi:ATP-dependent helicase [Emticicia sp. CRIBPO]|uniref:DEAD/DEAH box helicase n=1 Tax=Emticicia sp. CRIBPO TaxID=2683258 RepID=UPI00141207EB|nr:DEAD/DEAH box helicase [Emticicia sp. CRIBPO]NBA85374.1 ATP-dependent helicase [Emticicia sp. CRIBPO]